MIKAFWSTPYDLANPLNMKMGVIIQYPASTALEKKNNNKKDEK